MAKTQVTDRQGDRANTLTIFLVDSSSPGLKVHENDDTIGYANQAKVTFRDVLIPDGN